LSIPIESSPHAGQLHHNSHGRPAAREREFLPAMVLKRHQLRAMPMGLLEHENPEMAADW